MTRKHIWLNLGELGLVITLLRFVCVAAYGMLVKRKR